MSKCLNTQTCIIRKLCFHEITIRVYICVVSADILMREKLWGCKGSSIILIQTASMIVFFLYIQHFVI